MIDQSRRRRIAAGAGVEPHEVNELVKQFDGMAAMMKEMSGMGMRDRMQEDAAVAARRLSRSRQLSLAEAKVGTGKRLTPDEKRKLKKQREKELRKKKRERDSKRQLSVVTSQLRNDRPARQRDY